MWRADRDGSNRVELVDPPLEPMLPSWSPDGKQIVFVGLTQKENEYQSYIVSSQGGAIHRLLPRDGGPQTDPNWSPDGKKIVYSTSRLGGRDTEKRNSRAGYAHRRGHHPSRIGRHVLAALVSRRKIHLRIDLRSAQHQPLRPCDPAWTVLHKGIIAFPAWSADSRFIYYLSYVDDPGVFRVRVATGEVERVLSLMNVPYTGTLGSWMALDPTDAPLMLRDTGTNDIYALTPVEQ